jgi:hypothetical protein
MLGRPAIENLWRIPASGVRYLHGPVRTAPNNEPRLWDGERFTHLPLLLLLLFSMTGCSKKEHSKSLTEWPPRTGAHDAEAALAADAELAMGFPEDSPLKTSIAQSTDGSGGFGLPDRRASKVTGALESTLGPIKKRASFGGIGYIFTDERMSKPVSYSYLLTAGELLLSVEDLWKEAPPNAFVENRFEISDFGPRFVLLRLDPNKNHQLAIYAGDSGFVITASWPGTKADINGMVVDRKLDGWYVGDKMLKLRESAQ